MVTGVKVFLEAIGTGLVNTSFMTICDFEFVTTIPPTRELAVGLEITETYWEEYLFVVLNADAKVLGDQDFIADKTELKP